eukprot:2509414-Amphidinium_carterae.1
MHTSACKPVKALTSVEGAFAKPKCNKYAPRGGFGSTKSTVQARKSATWIDIAWKHKQASATSLSCCPLILNLCIVSVHVCGLSFWGWSAEAADAYCF